MCLSIELLTEDLLQMAERKREQGEERENIKLLKPKMTRNKSYLPWAQSEAWIVDSTLPPRQAWEGHFFLCTWAQGSTVWVQIKWKMKKREEGFSSFLALKSLHPAQDRAGKIVSILCLLPLWGKCQWLTAGNVPVSLFPGCTPAFLTEWH